MWLGRLGQSESLDLPLDLPPQKLIHQVVLELTLIRVSRAELEVLLLPHCLCYFHGPCVTKIFLQLELILKRLPGWWT